MSYEGFAYLYDELMKDVPYEKWIGFIERYRELYPSSGRKILDLACGTGEISIRLAKLGYQVTGVDLSADMLTVAQRKAELEQVKVELIEQNMAELELVDEYDLVGIFCDSLNYLQTEDEVNSTFQQISRYMKKGGLLLFDIHSLFKINEIFMDQTFTYDEDGICYIWNCFEGEFPNTVDHELTFFVEDSSGKYDRVDENHTQRTFPVHFYTRWLEDAGFELLETVGDFEGPVHEQTERIFFVSRKK